jgi:hypothetical protein
MVHSQETRRWTVRLRRASFLTVLALTGSVPAVRAQNLVVNAQFDNDVNSWTVVSPVSTNITWSSLDWQGSPTSGSGLVTNIGITPGMAGAQNPCLVTTVAGNYELGSQIRVPLQTNVGAAWVSLWFYGSPSCTGNPTGVVSTPAVPTFTPDVWLPVLTAGFSVPAGQAYRVELTVHKQLFGPDVRAHFDFVRFGLEGTTPVQLQQFKVE